MTDEYRTRDELVAEIRELEERIRGFEVLKAEIKCSERELRIKEKVVEASISGIAIADLAGNLTYANRAILEMWGFPDEVRVLGRHFTEFVDDPAEALRIREELLTRGFYVGETVARRRDGSLFDIQFYANMVKDDVGMPFCLMLSCVDVTERKTAEVVQAHLSAIVASSSDAIISISLDGIFRTWNMGAEGVYGYEAREVIGLPASLLSPGERSHEASEMLGRIRQGQRIDDHETVHLRKDGSLISVSMTISSIKDPDGGIAGASMIVRDITERKRIEEALRASEERYRELVQNANSIILKLDNTGTITFFNEFAQEFFGYTEDEIVGRNALGSIVPHTETTGRDLAAMMTDILSNPEGYLKNENENVKKSGERVWISWTNRPVRDDRGGLVGILAVGLDITERRQMEEIIRQQATHDSLTGLPNRSLFMDRLTLELSQAQRSRSLLAIMFLDIDRFKEINDSLGHTVGDALLCDVAERLKACVRESDTVARIGGDEFNILLTDIRHAEYAGTIAKKLLSTFTLPFVINGNRLSATSSIGISVYPEDGQNAEALLKSADIAMYHAKEKGKNNYQFYCSTLNSRTFERNILENSLRRMIERGELLVYYQPHMNIGTRKMVCAEALVRWQHPELGLLSPSQFIPLAEETGFIMPIDEAVLRTACAQNRRWLDAGYPSMLVTVNLSSRHLRQPDFPEIISEVLRETGLEPQSLGVELSENTIMESLDSAAPNLRRLSGMGVRISIDNYGAGNLSLCNLKKIPVQKIKIDRSFIRGLATDPDYKDIVRAVIAMAHNLKLEVVAEGVETNDQLAFLHTSRCDEMQGYLFSRPLPADKFERLVTLAK